MTSTPMNVPGIQPVSIETTSDVSNAPTTSLNEFQQQALDSAKKIHDDLKKEMETQKYLVDINTEDLNALSAYIANDAPWKFTECLGIVEVTKELKVAQKAKKLFTGAIAIEAIYYYLSKVEGKGYHPTSEKGSFTDIDQYIRVIKGISSAVERIKIDNDKVRQAEFILAARMEGIDPEQPEATVTEGPQA